MDTSSRVYLETRTRTSEHDVEIDETAQDSDGSNSYGVAFSDPTKLSSVRIPMLFQPTDDLLVIRQENF